jgi:class 3 adenylate cyclase
MGERLFQFDDFELDGAAFELRRAGRVLHLERIPMELLLLLVERWGELVTRDEILERIWGKEVFFDVPNAINTAVRKIRRMLEDPASAPRLLITVPTKGYRFIAPHHHTAAQPASIAEAGIARADSEPLRGEPQVGSSAERRRLTALFCDLENSVILTADHDAEEWRELLASFRNAAAECIERFGGSVAQYSTDGVRSYFGWPEAHDNDAELAAHASLAILDAAAQLNRRPQQAKLVARIGLHTGTVVVNAGDSEGADVFGAVPIVAARVLEAAAGGTVLATADTHRLIAGLFVVEDRGPQALKGIEQPIQLFRLAQSSGRAWSLRALGTARPDQIRRP